MASGKRLVLATSNRGKLAERIGVRKVITGAFLAIALLQIWPPLLHLYGPFTITADTAENSESTAKRWISATSPSRRDIRSPIRRCP